MASGTSSSCWPQRVISAAPPADQIRIKHEPVSPIDVQHGTVARRLGKPFWPCVPTTRPSINREAHANIPKERLTSVGNPPLFGAGSRRAGEIGVEGKHQHHDHWLAHGVGILSIARGKECYANFECRLADGSLISKYALFIWEVVKHVASFPKYPRTVHYRVRASFLKTGAALGTAIVYHLPWGMFSQDKPLSPSSIAPNQSLITQRRTLGSGKNSLEVSALGFGCMGMNYHRGLHPDRSAMIKLLRQTAERGGRRLDCAVMSDTISMNTRDGGCGRVLLCMTKHIVCERRVFPPRQVCMKKV